MELIKSYENEVATRIAQHPERVEIKDCLVQIRRMSSRLQNQPKIYYGIDKKMPMNSGTNARDNSVERRTKLNDLMLQQTLVKVGASRVSDTCPHSCGYGDGNNDSSLLVFDELDLRGILSLKQMLRLPNLRRLESIEKKQNRRKKVDNNQAIAKILRTNKADKNRVDDKHVPGLNMSKYLLKKLRRLAKMGVDKVIHFAQGQVSRPLPASPCLVCKDISHGQEAISILVTNECEDPAVAPAGFTYITSNHVASNVKVPSSAPGCQCKGSCRNTRTCSCASLNGSEFPYVSRNGGRLIEPRDVVFECGPRCGCGPDCGNKISQKGLKYRLEVYRTTKKGWAVRTWDFIPSGAPVVEYIGVLNKSDDLDTVADNEYIFEIDCLHTINGVEGRERRVRSVSLPTNTSVEKRNDETMKNGPEFCIDASSFGNVARFINHGCEPNLFVQCVLSSHLDIRLARVVLFAARDIYPSQELTYDYGYILDSVVGPDGQIKQLPCYCGTAECRKRLY